METTTTIYQDIATRTDGDVYLGVVGPVRTGKSTFIKRFMETLVIPRIDNVYMRERAKDELPQSGSGRTIMTAEPKFVPEEAVSIELDEGVSVSLRLIDCVGYMVDSAAGRLEDGTERMVTTPWFEEEVSLTEAAERGTHRVISEHSTIGLVITTDGTICDIPREDYVEAEERVVKELQTIGKPFLIVLNSAQPRSETARELACSLAEKYGVSCVCLSCLELTENDITNLMRTVLNEFPLAELDVFLPSWVDALSLEHPIRSEMLEAVRSATHNVRRIRDVYGVTAMLAENENVEEARLRELRLGAGQVLLSLSLPRELYYRTISEQSGFEIADDGDLMALLTEMRGIKQEYDRVSAALSDVREKGYGVVLPSEEELRLEEPQIVRQAGRYSVRLKASAPSIHMIRANIETEVSPALGGEKSSEEIINFLLQGFEGDTSRIWESNIFGKSLYEIASEGLTGKIRRLSGDAQSRLQEAIQRIINEGSGGLICIVF
ncbi:MAG: stage IV sporulation protein A [Eubacteriales bacterium]|nr:stage IV sporulation protein A [Eubacteriales bacterium]